MRSFILSGAMLLATFANVSLAAPANETTQAQDAQWVQFCNDDACNEGCGSWVSVTNPGCLNENGRNSFKVKGYAWDHVKLVQSPDADCPCQSGCRDTWDDSGNHDGYLTSGACYPIKGDYSSFRWVSEQACGANNC